MTVRELTDLLDVRFPRALSCEWDNDGLQVASDPDATVTGVLIALDPTDAAVAEAERTGCSVLLTHHPLIFDPLAPVPPDGGIGRRTRRLLAGGISSISLHTRADAAEGGVNDALAARIGLSSVSPFADGLPRIGRFPSPLPVREAVGHILCATGAKTALYAGNTPGIVSRVAVCGGAGKEYLRAAAEAGCDLYLSGELSYHARLDALDLPLLSVEIGHDASEIGILTVFASYLSNAAPSLRTVVFPYFAGDGFSGGRLDI